MKLKFDVSDYSIVKEKSTERFFVIRKSDTPFGKWNNMLDEEITCIPISKNGELEKMSARPIKRKDLDNNIWIRYMIK